jgi:hypothetical protein
MRKFIIILLFLSKLNLSFAQYTIEDFKKLHTLVGKWERDIKKGMTHEFWEKNNETTLSSKSMSIVGKDTVLRETVLLELKDNEIFYTVTVAGQNNEKPVAFKLTKIENNTFYFENPKHDFPQRIIYFLKHENQLVVTIDGKIDGIAKKIDFYFSRMSD